MSTHSSMDHLATALSFKREAWDFEAILDGLGRDPSHERDVAYDAWVEARERYRALITSAWLHRLASRVQRRAA